LFSFVESGAKIAAFAHAALKRKNHNTLTKIFMGKWVQLIPSGFANHKREK
jgi:hypothetical protein